MNQISTGHWVRERRIYRLPPRRVRKHTYSPLPFHMPQRPMTRAQRVWFNLAESAVERLLLLLGWERRAPASTSKPVREKVYAEKDAKETAAAKTTSGPEGFFGTEAPTLKMQPVQPPTHVAGDPYAWNADPFTAGANTGTV